MVGEVYIAFLCSGFLLLFSGFFFFLGGGGGGGWLVGCF